MNDGGYLAIHFAVFYSSFIILAKRMPKRILGSSISGKKPVGKPRKSCVNAVEIDSTGILKMRNFNTESLDRQVWSRHLKQAMAQLRAVTP
jgi:hypothetical protein